MSKTRFARIDCGSVNASVYRVEIQLKKANESTTHDDRLHFSASKKEGCEEKKWKGMRGKLSGGVLISPGPQRAGRWRHHVEVFSRVGPVHRTVPYGSQERDRALPATKKQVGAERSDAQHSPVEKVALQLMVRR